jgi:hypothetical protein
MDGHARAACGLPALSFAQRASLIGAVSADLLVPALVARFGAPPVGGWRHDAGALSACLAELPLNEAVAALAELNPGGQMFRPVCRDILLPAARRLRRNHDPAALDQSERLVGLWHLRMCLASLDDCGTVRAVPVALRSALTVSGAADLPSVEHGVALRFFDRAGWEVSDCRGRDGEEACDSAHDHAFDVAWISLEPGMAMGDIRATARSLRRASCNAAMLVLGGGMAGLHPEDPAELELDGYTGSAIQAAAVADAALRRHRTRPFVG